MLRVAHNQRPTRSKIWQIASLLGTAGTLYAFLSLTSKPCWVYVMRDLGGVSSFITSIDWHGVFIYHLFSTIHRSDISKIYLCSCPNHYTLGKDKHLHDSYFPPFKFKFKLNSKSETSNILKLKQQHVFTEHKIRWALLTLWFKWLSEESRVWSIKVTIHVTFITWALSFSLTGKMAALARWATALVLQRY